MDNPTATQPGSAPTPVLQRTTRVRLRVWGATESDVERAITEAHTGWGRRTWDVVETERLTGLPCPIDVRNPDPKAIVADAGYHWAFIALRVEQ